MLAVLLVCTDPRVENSETPLQVWAIGVVVEATDITMAFERATDGLRALAQEAGREYLDMAVPSVSWRYVSIEDAIADARQRFPDESDVRGEIHEIAELFKSPLKLEKIIPVVVFRRE